MFRFDRHRVHIDVGRELDIEKVRLDPVPTLCPWLFNQLYWIESVSLSTSDTFKTISSVTLASTAFPGVMLKLSMDGAVFCTTMEVDELMLSPSSSDALAVQNISSVGSVVFASMVNVFPTDGNWVPSSNVQV